MDNADNKARKDVPKKESGKCGYVVAVRGVQTPGKPLLVSMNVEIL